MTETDNWLTHDHRKDEEMLLECEQLAEQEEWDRTSERLAQLQMAYDEHFQMEEQVVFPAYEQLTDTPKEPTRQLRSEHWLLRDLLNELGRAAVARDSAWFQRSAVALGKLMAEHHGKEEAIFLPMAGHALLGRREEVLARLQGGSPPPS